MGPQHDQLSLCSIPGFLFFSFVWITGVRLILWTHIQHRHLGEIPTRKTHIREVDLNTAEVALVKYIGHGMFTIFAIAGFLSIFQKTLAIRKRPRPTVVTNPSPCHLGRIWVFTNRIIMESMGFLCPDKKSF